MLYGEPEYRRRARQKAEQNKEVAEREQNKAAENANFDKVVVSLDRVSEKIDRHADRTKPKHKREWQWKLAEVVGLWLAAFVGVGAVWVGNHDAREQRNITQGQLNEMQVAQRAWIKIVPESIGALRVANIAPRAPWFSLDVTYKLSNVGRSPAFNIGLSLWGFVPYDGHDDIVAEQKDRCDLYRRQHLDNPARGNILFPGDQATDIQLTGGFGHLISGSIGPFPPSAFIDKDGKKYVRFWVYGCADYGLTAASAERHQTGLIYYVGHMVQSDSGEVLDIYFDTTENLPGDKIRLVPFPSGSGQTD